MCALAVCLYEAASETFPADLNENLLEPTGEWLVYPS